jgi:hypothetical protein
MTNEHISVETQVEFRSLAGDSITATVQEVAVTSTVVSATVTLSWDSWQRVVAEGLYHLDGTETPGSFEADLPVELRLQLRSAFAADVADDPNELEAQLSDPEDPLCSTGAWYVTELSQELNLPDEVDMDGDAVASLGIETAWADWSPAEAAANESIRDIVTSHLDAEDWEYEVTEDEALFVQFPVAVDDQTWSVVVQVDELARSCLVYSFHPDPIPAASYAEICLRLNEANFDLGRGAFELDPSDGIVDFRTRVLPDQEQFGRVLHAYLRVAAGLFDTIDTLARDTPEAGPDESRETVYDLDDIGGGTDSAR